MRKLSIKNITGSILTLCVAVLFFASCSSSDDEDPAVVFTSLTTNKTDAFIEDIIVLNLEGTGYTDANLASNNTSVKITKVSSTIYEISSTVAATTNIYVALYNNTHKEHKSVTLNFYEHGIKDLNTVEGIKPNIDKASKVLSLLGEPDQKITSPTALTELWAYSSKGFGIVITKSSTIVSNINIYSSNYYNIQENGSKVYYINYPYDLGNGWKINNANTTMDMIIAKFGAATTKNSSSDPASTVRSYGFAYQNRYFNFYGNTVDDYSGKKIISVTVY